MSSCILFHGPGAREAVLKEVLKTGPLIAPPFGDEGLKTDDAREIVTALYSIPVGVSVGTVVVGPMDSDRANPKACDVLLKRLEEFDDGTVQPFLWAYDLGSVTPTIRSRCLARWAPADVPDDEELENLAIDLVDRVLEGRLARIAPMLKKIESKRLPDLIGAIALQLSIVPEDKARMVIWERVRKVSLWKNPTMVELVGALVGGAV